VFFDASALGLEQLVQKKLAHPDSLRVCRILPLERRARAVPEFIAALASCNIFIAVLTEQYRRAVEPTVQDRCSSTPGIEGFSYNPDDGWVWDEWHFAGHLEHRGRITRVGIWRSGPIVPFPFNKDEVFDFRDDAAYAGQIQKYFSA